MRSRATAAFVGLGLVWGSNFIFMKWAAETITPSQITLLRVFFGLVPVLGYAVITRSLDRNHLRHWPHFLVMSVLATSFYFFAFAAGTALLPSGTAGALSGSIPLFAFVGAAVFLRSEPITPVRALGVVIGFVGVFLGAPVAGVGRRRPGRRAPDADRFGQCRPVVRLCPTVSQ